MSTKSRLLSLLESHKGSYQSGEELAAALGVSRTAVWKAVNALRLDGYDIDAIQNRGYSLSTETDVLCADGIRRYLENENGISTMEVIPTVSSTNSVLRERAHGGAPEGTVILAASQTNGRGRRGRDFYSPSDTGIYLSLLLRPRHMSPAESVKLTTMAAVAASRAIEAVSGRETGIKWVNDIFMDGKKVCGILTEGAYDLESGSMEYVVVGIGINVYPPQEGFPDSLSSIAGAVLPTPRQDGKNCLAAAFLREMMSIYRSASFEDYSQEYRRRSFVIGREVEVLVPGGMRSAVALDVDKDCRLIVRYEDGTVESLSSAEVSIRKKSENP